jgi:hypothetical protein
MRKNVFNFFVIVISLFLSKVIYSQDINYGFANDLYERLNRNGKVISVGFTIGEDRGIFNNPKSFTVVFHFSNNLPSLSISYLNSDKGKLKKVVLIEKNEKEDITYLVKGVRLNRWTRATKREFRKIPSGQRDSYEIN